MVKEITDMNELLVFGTINKNFKRKNIDGGKTGVRNIVSNPFWSTTNYEEQEQCSSEPSFSFVE